MKKTIKILIVILLIVCVALLEIFFNTFLKNLILLNLITGISLGIIAIVMLINFVIILKQRKFEKGMKIKTFIEILEDAKANIHANTRKNYDKLKKIIFLGNLYIFFLVIVLFIFGSSIINYNAFFGGLSAICIVDIVKGFFFKNIEKDGNEFLLIEEEFPYVYGIVRTYFQKMNVKYKLEIKFVGDTQISVNVIGRLCTIYLGAEALMALSDKEFESVICHEIAHIHNKDTKMSEYFYKTEKKFVAISEKTFYNFSLNYLFLKAYITFLSFNMEIFKIIINILCEQNADSLISKYSDPQEFINATAKIELNAHYVELDIYHSLYKNENPPTNYVNNSFEYFMTHFNDNREMMIGFLEKNIPSTFSSHPTFKQRQNNLGVKAYSIDYNISKSEEFKNETQKIVDKMNGIIEEDLKKEWDESRKLYYLKYIDEVESFEKEENCLDSIKIASAAFAYKILENQEKVLELCDKAIELSSSNAFAYYLKGSALLSENIEEGVSLLKTAGELSPNYLESSHEKIAIYYKRNGMNDEREKFKLESMDATQIMIDDKSYDIFEPHAKFSDCLLDEEHKEKIRNKIKEFSCIESASIISKNCKNGRAVHFIGLYFGSKFTDKEMHDAFDEILFYLDNSDKSKDFALYVISGRGEKLMRDKFYKIKTHSLYEKNLE